MIGLVELVARFDGLDMLPEPQCPCEDVAITRCKNCKTWFCQDCYASHNCWSAL